VHIFEDDLLKMNPAEGVFLKPVVLAAHQFGKKAASRMLIN